MIHHENNKEIPIESIRKFQQELISCQVPVKLITNIENINAIDEVQPIKANPEIMRNIENFLQEFLL